MSEPRLLRRVAPAAAVPVAYTLLAMLLFRDAWAAPRSNLIGNIGDPYLLMWFLEWTPHALSHGLNPLLTTHLNYPAGVNVLWNTSMLLPGTILAPVTMAFGPIAAYNVMATANLALSGWAAHALARRLGASWAGSFVAGVVYGFAPYMLAQSHDHADLTAAYVPPLFGVLLHELLVRRRWSPATVGVLIGLLATAQLLINEEILLTTVIVAAGSLAALAFVTPATLVRDSAGRLAQAAGPMLCTFVPLAALPLGYQLFGPGHVHGTLQPADTFVTDVANLIVPTDVQAFSTAASRTGALPWTGNLAEWDSFVGAALIAVVAYSLIRERHNSTFRALAAIVGVAVVLSFGPELHVAGHLTGIPMPWRFLEAIPLVGNSLPVRLMLYAYLGLAVAVALITDGLWERRRAGREPILVALGLLVGLAALLPARASAVTPEVPAFFRDGTLDPIVPDGSVALVAPFGNVFPDEPMLWQAVASLRFRMPEGYFVGPASDGQASYGVQPSTMQRTLEDINDGKLATLTPDLCAALTRDLRARDVDTVIVGPMLHQDLATQLFTGLYSRKPVEAGGVLVWTNVAALPTCGG